MHRVNWRRIQQLGPILGALIAPGLGFAQQTFPDYFPLQVGNQWVYRSVVNRVFRTVSVAGTQQVNDVTYAVVLQDSDPATTMLLRNDGAGKIYRYDPVKQQETVAYDFTRPPANGTLDGTPFTETTAGKYSGPLGDFDNAFTISRMTTLSASSQTFLPYIGEVASSSSLRGGSASLVPPLIQNLVYARLNDITVLTTKDWGFGITLDRPVYRLQFGQTDDCQGTNFPLQTASPTGYAPCAQVRLTLRAVGSDPVHLSFPTQQLYELELRDSTAAVIWRLSDQTVFRPDPRELVVGPGEVNFEQLVPLYTPGNFPPTPLPPGTYSLSAALQDVAGGSASASIQFKIIQ